MPAPCQPAQKTTPVGFIVEHAHVSGQTAIGRFGRQVQFVAERGRMSHKVAQLGSDMAVAIKTGVEDIGDTPVVVRRGAADAVAGGDLGLGIRPFPDP